ncbi:hypothetical protein [Brevibacillus dissolubilis]|uniref:hypothetical protein n=1 Tax=Brevibacillus dissolubilis TaxID=1844116 RepID=UPI0011163E6A|nr:hypothetical protein [Brevibacillus dissolubilis]
MNFVLVNGLLAGMILAAFLALCDGIFQTSTFQVLIDTSYVPYLEGLHPIVELGIHLLISILVTFLYMFFYPRPRGNTVAKYAGAWMLAFLLLYFPFSLLSGEAMTIAGWLIWLIGHIIYTLFLTYQIEK